MTDDDKQAFSTMMHAIYGYYGKELTNDVISWTPVEIGVDVTAEGTHVVGMYVLMPEAVRHVFYSQFHPAPPQREWQRLTDEEIDALDMMADEPHFDEIKEFARAIEAKLKEKNT